MRSKLGNEARLRHILDAITELEAYTREANFDEFQKNSMMKFASIKQLEIIGKAANHVTDDLKAKFEKIPWC